ncbi:MAG: uroporphyrinogen decarboxylase family protein [Phycisphaerae bacterium]
MIRQPLPRDEVVKAIEHRRPSRVPMMIHQWNWAGAFGERTAEVEAIQAEYPQDFFQIIPRMPNYWDDLANSGHIPGYSWMHTPPPAASGPAKGHDANVAITDWAMLDDMLAAWPDPNQPQMYEGAAAHLAANAGGRYTGIHWWFCLYERLWSLRGMENILCDFYLNPEPVHRLMDALTDFYCGVIRRGGELGVDCVYTTDDIGMQTGPMFGIDVFREFFKPRYQRMIKTAHDCGMHFWLHTCGDVRLFMEDFIEIGLDVIHPIQKYTMNEREVAERFGGRICFWTGMDVQQILPRGTSEDVRREVRFMIDTYDRPDGGCMVTAGNGITADVPVENLRAFYDETYNYGLAHRRGK